MSRGRGESDGGQDPLGSYRSPRRLLATYFPELYALQSMQSGSCRNLDGNSPRSPPSSQPPPSLDTNAILGSEATSLSFSLFQQNSYMGHTSFALHPGPRAEARSSPFFARPTPRTSRDRSTFPSCLGTRQLCLADTSSLTTLLLLPSVRACRTEKEARPSDCPDGAQQWNSFSFAFATYQPSRRQLFRLVFVFVSWTVLFL